MTRFIPSLKRDRISFNSDSIRYFERCQIAGRTLHRLLFIYEHSGLSILASEPRLKTLAKGVRQICGYHFIPWRDIPRSLPNGH